jgi:hypothetical protein
MVNIQIITNVFDPLQTKTYWKWKVVAIPEDMTPSDLGQYRTVTLAKVILEWTRLKYTGTVPPLTDIMLGVVPFQDYNKFQLVVEEGDTVYDRLDDVNYMAHTIIRFKCYAKWATLGETFFDLESLLIETDSIWMNYDPHRINGLGNMFKLTKLTQQGAPLDENPNQTQSSNYIKTLEYQADYQIARTTTLPSIAFTYAQVNTAGDYATN